MSLEHLEGPAGRAADHGVPPPRFDVCHAALDGGADTVLGEQQSV